MNAETIIAANWARRRPAYAKRTLSRARKLCNQMDSKTPGVDERDDLATAVAVICKCDCPFERGEDFYGDLMQVALCRVDWQRLVTELVDGRKIRPQRCRDDEA